MFASDENRPMISHTTNNLLDGVVVPGLQSAITGVLAGFVAGGLVWVCKWKISGWQVGFLVGSTAAFVGWLSYRSTWQYMLEGLLGLDLNRDGVVGQPVASDRLRVELVQDHGHKGDFIDLPYADRLPALASGLLAGQTFSQSVWTGSGAVFSRAEFEDLRGKLLERGLARWKRDGAPAQGVELTPAGRAVFRRIGGAPLPSWSE